MALFFDATVLVPPIRYNKGERKGYGMGKDLFALETVRKEIEDICESAEGGVLRLEDYFTPDLDAETSIDLVALIPTVGKNHLEDLVQTCADHLAAMKRLLEIPEEKREEAIAKALAGEGRIAAFCKIYLEPIRIKELREEDQEILERVQNSDMTGEETTPRGTGFLRSRLFAVSGRPRIGCAETAVPAGQRRARRSSLHHPCSPASAPLGARYARNRCGA